MEEPVCRIVVDGAWSKEIYIYIHTWRGVVAWCMLGANGFASREEGRLKVNASSAFMVEAIVVLKALEWAWCKGWKWVEILTDCL